MSTSETFKMDEAVVLWRMKMISRSGRSMAMNKDLSSLFYGEVGKIGSMDVQHVSFGSVWLVFYGHALVAISRYSMQGKQIEAFAVRDVANAVPLLAHEDYKRWVGDVDDKLLQLHEEYTTPPAEWLAISVEDIHAKAATWFGDEVSSMVQDRLTGGD
jgi:hypothetical protein